MAYTLVLLTLCIMVSSITIYGAIIELKPLSPSSNVHVDVVNHVAASLTSHSQQFQHTWRDYSIVLLLILVLGSCFLLTCGITVVCLYRRLLIQLLHRSPSTRAGHLASAATDRSPGIISTIT